MLRQHRTMQTTNMGLATKAALSLLTAVVLAGCGGGDETTDSKTNFDILDPKGTHFGKSYGEWGAAWWKWVYELPQKSATECVLPPDDPTGANCGYGQDDQSSVFFLAGNFGGVSVRSECKVAADKTLFFPILNYGADNGGVPPAEQLDEAGLQGAVKAFVDSVDLPSMFVKIDGKAVGDLAAYSTAPTKFDYTLPAEPNTYTCLGLPGVTGKVDPAYAGGYWLMLSGLGKGSHEIRFGGTTKEADPFSLDVTYALTLE